MEVGGLGKRGEWGMIQSLILAVLVLLAFMILFGPRILRSDASLRDMIFPKICETSGKTATGHLAELSSLDEDAVYSSLRQIRSCFPSQRIPEQDLYDAAQKIWGYAQKHLLFERALFAFKYYLEQYPDGAKSVEIRGLLEKAEQEHRKSPTVLLQIAQQKEATDWEGAKRMYKQVYDTLLTLSAPLIRENERLLAQARNKYIQIEAERIAKSAVVSSTPRHSPPSYMYEIRFSDAKLPRYTYQVNVFFIGSSSGAIDRVTMQYILLFYRTPLPGLSVGSSVGSSSGTALAAGDTLDGRADAATIAALLAAYKKFCSACQRVSASLDDVLIETVFPDAAAAREQLKDPRTLRTLETYGSRRVGLIGEP